MYPSIHSKLAENTKLSPEEQEFFNSLREQSVVVEEVEYNLEPDAQVQSLNLYKLMTQNSGNTSIGFKMLLESVFEKFIKVSPSFRTTINKPVNKGIFGNIAGWQCCIETQARGTLHAHFVCYGGLTSQLIEAVGQDDDLKKATISTIDSHAQASVLFEDMLLHKALEKGELDMDVASHKLPERLDEFQYNDKDAKEALAEKVRSDATLNAVNKNHHRCGFTCAKGKKGCKMCRLAMPQECREETAIFQIFKREVKKKEEGMFDPSKDSPQLELVEGPIEDPPVQTSDQQYFNPFPRNDPRVIMFEIKRPSIEHMIKQDTKITKLVKDKNGVTVKKEEVSIEKFAKEIDEGGSKSYHFESLKVKNDFNGSVCAFNVTLMTSLKCNQAIYILGAQEQGITS